MEGQSPSFLFLGCRCVWFDESPSCRYQFRRLFHLATPACPKIPVSNVASGTLFAERGVVDRFTSNDINAVSILSYAVSKLGIGHAIAMDAGVLVLRS